MKFSVNTMNFFAELSFRERLAVIKGAGFNAVEILFPHLQGLEAVKSGVDEHGLDISIIDVQPGDISRQDWNAAVDPGRRDEFKRYADDALTFATELNVPQVNCLAGVKTDLPGCTEMHQLDTYRENLSYICDLFKGTGIHILIEPISEGSLADYLINDASLAVEIIRDLNRSNLALQFDFFHIQLLHGNLAGNLKRYFELIRYFQVANPPGRNEPGCGEIDFAFLLRLVGEMGYQGYIGLEYHPSGRSEASLQWVDDWGLSGSGNGAI